MKSFTILFVLYFSCCSLYGQNIKFFHEDGTIKRIGETSDKLSSDGWYLGEWKDFANNGNLTAYGTYLYKDGKYKIFDYKGSLILQSQYITSRGEDVVFNDKFFNSDGTLLSEGESVNGFSEGKHIYYFPDGSVSKKISFKRGIYDGEFIFFNLDGSISSTGFYQLGKPYGFWVSYYEDGSLYSEFNYVLGKVDGQAKTYHRNGEICSNNQYLMGNLVGSAKKYYDNGQIEYEQAYLDGKKHGLGARVDTDGKYLWVTKYENGKIIDEETRARNAFLFNEINRTNPFCSKYLQPIDGPRAPDYPKTALRRGKEGCVFIDFVINEEGKTEDIKVGWSVPEKTFNKNSIKYVSDLVFPKPKDKNGLPTKTESKFILVFKIEDNSKSLDYIPPGCE